MTSREHQPIAEIRDLYKVFGPAEQAVKKALRSDHRLAVWDAFSLREHVDGLIA